ncbi:MAG: hypothetical protein V4613_14135 [Bacteroidota bacterium]
MKITIIILTLVLFSCKQQPVASIPPNDKEEPSFYLKYFFVGLGPNAWNKWPVIIVKGTKLIYTYQQTSSWTGEFSKDKDTILMTTIRLSSIDSIRNILGNLKDTSIYETNPGIMSGGSHYLTIAFGQDTTSFELHNTFHYTALKITDLLNTYLPSDKKIWADEQMIIDEQKYWDWMKKQAKKNKSK